MPLLSQEGQIAEDTRRQKPINQWVRLNRTMNMYRLALVVLATTLIGFLLLTAYLVSRDTLVIGTTGGEKLFFLGERREVTIENADVEATTRLFIQRRYNWNSLNSDNLLKEIAPLTSPGLQKKIEDSIAKNSASRITFPQDVIIRNIALQEGKVLAIVDRVIQVSEKMKVVSPLELTLTLVRGSPNRWNPLGLYVNSVTEHEGE